MVISEQRDPVPGALRHPARTATYPVAHAAAEALGAWQARVPHAALPALETETGRQRHSGPGRAPASWPTWAHWAQTLAPSLTHLEASDAWGPGRALRAQRPLKSEGR